MPAKSIIKGSLTAIILKLLEENGKMYGYEITKKVKESSKEQMNISEAALYPALHKLVADGLLTTETTQIDGRIRKYYSLTKKGKKRTSIEIESLKQAIASLSLILNPQLKNG
jgi:DNA-binding PadR family transcriptional regulator